MTTMHDFMEKLWRFPRSLTGYGVRQTIDAIADELPGLQHHEVPTGTKVFDWEVPQEWRLNHAVVTDEHGEILLDTNDNNLHVVGYSEDFVGWVSWQELEKHMHTDPEHPNWIPYVTAYYQKPRTWGVCMEHRRWMQAMFGGNIGDLYVKVDTELFDGSMSYADLVIEGREKSEIFLTTYICHPQMANNELSGPVVLTWLAKWLRSQPRRYTYRILFAPETLGALTYLASGQTTKLGYLRDHVRAGYVLTCLGGPGDFELQYGRTENYATRLAEDVVSFESIKKGKHHDISGWQHRGSDERQFCWPGVDLPMASIRKTPPGHHLYPQYHTSGDDLDYVTQEQLEESLSLMKRIVEGLENDRCWHATTIGEPFLGKRGLYANVSKVGSSASGKALLDVLSLCDGSSLLEISDRMGKPIEEVQETIDVLLEHELVREV